MIHPTAVIAPGAKIGEGVDIGPYTVVDENVQLGDGCRVGPHVHLTGHTTIGAATVIHAGAVIGDTPQDVHYQGARAFTQIGHNCNIAKGVIIGNATLLAGHVHVHERAFISAGVAIHQFVRIGTLAMVGGMNRIYQDVPPYCMLQREAIQGANVVGLRRAGFAPDKRAAIRGAIKVYFFAGLNRMNALADIRARYGEVPEVQALVRFCETSKRGITAGRGTEPEVDPDAAADA